MGRYSYFLGMKFQMSKQGMVLHQRNTQGFRMEDSNHASWPIEPNLKLKKHGKDDKVDTTLFK